MCRKLKVIEPQVKIMLSQISIQIKHILSTYFPGWYHECILSIGIEIKFIMIFCINIKVLFHSLTCLT